MKKLIGWIENQLGLLGILVVGVSIFLMMVIEVLNAFGRKFFTPFPCTVETAESLMITSVFLGLAYVSLKEEHTLVSLVTRKTPPMFKRLLDALSNIVGAFVFGILATGAWVRALDSVRMMEVRYGAYKFPIWPFRILFALGLTLFVFQLFINTIKFVSQAFDPNWKPGVE